MTRIGAALALIWAPTALAGACCIGATTAVPTRLGPCEHAIATLSVGGEMSMARWTSGGAVTSSSTFERAAIASLGAGVSLSRRFQLGASIPVLANQRGSALDTSWGGGPGDLRVTSTWLAAEERWVEPGRFAPPAPVLTVGARLPTGRSWSTSTDPWMADVTGLPGPALIVGALAQRSMGDTPWMVGVKSETGAVNGAIAPSVAINAAVGRTLGNELTALATLSHTETLVRGTTKWARSGRTTVGARLVTGRRLSWRAWAALDADLPVPGLGANRMVMARASVGAAIVR